MLTREELERYDRQIRLFGVEAQEKLKRSRALIVGLGGLGSPTAIYLAAAGVGELLLIDFEKVELSNLNRQLLHWTKDLGRLKTESAAEKLKEINPHVSVEVFNVRADEELLDELIRRADVALDCVDNWETRFALNRVAVRHGKPFVHAGVRGMWGQLLVVVPGKTPCLNCLIPLPPREEAKLPMLGTTSGVMAALQATEAIKLLTGYGRPALNKLVVYDGFSTEFSEIPVVRNPKCPICGSEKR